jgi:hypothetical protein
MKMTSSDVRGVVADPFHVAGQQIHVLGRVLSLFRRNELGFKLVLFLILDQYVFGQFHVFAGERVQDCRGAFSG